MEIFQLQTAFARLTHSVKISIVPNALINTYYRPDFVYFTKSSKGDVLVVWSSLYGLSPFNRRRSSEKFKMVCYVCIGIDYSRYVCSTIAKINVSFYPEI